LYVIRAKIFILKLFISNNAYDKKGENMTLNEVVRSGKRFARRESAALGDYSTSAEFLENGLGINDFNATDYELEPDAPIAVVPLTLLAQAWDKSREGRDMANAVSSKFFARLTANLKSLNINITN
jgi:hypothetical protein